MTGVDKRGATTATPQGGPGGEGLMGVYDIEMMGFPQLPREAASVGAGAQEEIEGVIGMDNVPPLPYPLDVGDRLAPMFRQEPCEDVDLLSLFS